MAEERIESLANFKIRDIPDPPALTAFVAAEEAAAEAMSDEECWKLHNEHAARTGRAQVPTLEEFVKEWLS